MPREPTNAGRALVALTHLAAVAALLACLAPGFHDVPVSRDEGVYMGIARNVQGWLRLAAHAPGEAASAAGVDRFWARNHEHPGLSRFLAAGSRTLLDGRVDPISALRWGNALLAVLLALDCFHFMRPHFGAGAAWFSAAALFLIPCLYGHACIAAMDFPAAALGFLATTAFARGLESRRWALVFALYLGLGLDSKINAVFVPLPLVVWALAYRRPECVANLVAAAVIAPLVWIAAWPWLWHDTAARLVEYFQFHRQHHNPNAVYWGEVYRAGAPPWHYVWVYLIVSTPLGILLPAAMSTAGLAVDLWRRRRPDPITALLLVAMVAPVLVCSLPGVPRYDGPRLFLNAFPFVACLAGAGFSREVVPMLASAAGNRWRGALAPAAAALLLGSAAAGLYRIHPFEAYSYYDGLVGGPRGALRLGLSPVLWAMADRGAVEHLDRFAAPGEVIYNNTGATLPLHAYQEAGLLRDDLRFGPRPNWIVLEYNLAYSRWQEWWPLFEDRHPWYDRVLQVEADGAPVLGVFRARASPRRGGGRERLSPPWAPSHRADPG